MEKLEELLEQLCDTLKAVNDGVAVNNESLFNLTTVYAVINESLSNLTTVYKELREDVDKLVENTGAVK